MDRCLAHRLSLSLPTLAVVGLIVLDRSPAAAEDGLSCTRSALLLEQFGRQFEACHELAYDGDPAVEYIVAEMYILGRGVPADAGEGAVWLRRAADQGFAPAEAALGEVFRLGKGVDRNPAEAAKWCRRAAEQGFALAEQKLGEDYAEGNGVPRDNVLAYMWLTLAGGASPDAAHDERRRLAGRMTAEEIGLAEAFARGWRPRPAAGGLAGE